MTGTAGPGVPEDPEVPDADGLDVFDAPPAIPGIPATGTAGLAYAETPPADARLAHPGLRAFAFFLDGFATFLIVVIVVFLGLTSSADDVFLAIWIVPLVAALLDTVLTALRGVTPAKALLGLRVVDAVSGAPIGFLRATLRSLVIVAPILAGTALTALLSVVPDDVQYAFGGNFYLVAVLVPIAGWIALLVVLASRPRRRGLQDLAGRSVVVRR